MNNKIIEVVSIFLFTKSGIIPKDYEEAQNYFAGNANNTRLNRLRRKYGTK